jgi:hypothetical protein
MTTRRTRERILRQLVREVIPSARIYFPRKQGFRVGVSWNGRHLRPTGVTLESQIHEIAHLLVSPAERRALPEFGLGPDPYRRSAVERVASEADADREELDACTLQLLLVRLLDLDEAAVMLEVHTEPLTEARISALRERRPHALPSTWWERALATARERAPVERTATEARPEC